MNWLIVFSISLVVTIIVLSICGVGGGLMMLVTLNGFSESDATPILIFFVLMVIGISFALSTSASWFFIKTRHAETIFRFWHVAGISVRVNILTILIILAVVAVLRM